MDTCGTVHLSVFINKAASSLSTSGLFILRHTGQLSWQMVMKAMMLDMVDMVDMVDIVDMLDMLDMVDRWIWWTGEYC